MERSGIARCILETRHATRRHHRSAPWPPPISDVELAPDALKPSLSRIARREAMRRCLADRLLPRLSARLPALCVLIAIGAVLPSHAARIVVLARQRYAAACENAGCIAKARGHPARRRPAREHVGPGLGAQRLRKASGPPSSSRSVRSPAISSCVFRRGRRSCTVSPDRMRYVPAHRRCRPKCRRTRRRRGCAGSCPPRRRSALHSIRSRTRDVRKPSQQRSVLQATRR